MKNQQEEKNFFTCQKCGNHVLQEIQKNACIMWNVDGLSDDWQYFVYGSKPTALLNDKAETEYFQCEHCLHILRLKSGQLVRNFQEFMLWKRQQRPVTRNEAVMRFIDGHPSLDEGFLLPNNDEHPELVEMGMSIIIRLKDAAEEVIDKMGLENFVATFRLDEK